MKEGASFENFPAIGFVIATKRVVEEENPVCFMYREQPMDPKDSGWRIFAGDESQAYVDNSDNSGIYDPTTILTIDPSIRELLLKPIGSAFERTDGTSEWEESSTVVGTDELEDRSLGGGWHVKVSGIFDEDEDEEGDFVFAADGRTVRMAIWDFPDKTHEEVVTLHRDFIKNREVGDQPTLQSYDMTEPGIVRIGFLVSESDEDRTYKVLYGYTVIGQEVAQGAFYYDQEEDADWAMETWMSVGNN
jgi:hypothetical protein